VNLEVLNFDARDIVLSPRLNRISD
jgi:hypothetical protein